jgi:hypothetical protein
MIGTGACSATTTGGVTRTIGVYPAFSAAGAISGGSGTAFAAGTDPKITIGSFSDASGGDGAITYQWRRIQGSSSVTLTGSASTYSIGSDATNYSTAGTYSFRRYAHDGCNTAWKASSSTYTLRVSDWKSCSGFADVSNNESENGTTERWSSAKSICSSKGTGWRLPTDTELKCLCENKNNILGGYVGGGAGSYWSSTTYGSDGHYEVDFTNCTVNGYADYYYRFVKCVRDIDE